MAYALVMWRRDGEEEPVEEAFAEIPSITFFRGFFLIQDDGPEWTSVKERIQEVVEQFQGTQAVIVMPGKGTRVGGWVDNTPPPEALQAARAIMNRSGSSTVPTFFAIPPTNGGDD
jgi:hypothetical protein